MNRKEILKDSFSKAKLNFWVYLAAVAICFIITGLSDGVFESFGSLNRILLALRSGSFSYNALLDYNSEFWNVMTSNRGFLANFGWTGFLISIFIANPLAVGLCKMFTRDEPLFSSLTDVFKNNYLQLVKTTFVYNLLFGIIVSAISIIYVLANMFTVGIIGIAAGNTDAVVVPTILMIAVSLAFLVIYCVFTISITYNFSMINYILADNPEIDFSECYSISKQMVKGKKKKIFSVDVSVSVWSVIAVLVPTVLIVTGLTMQIMELGGISCIILGIFLIVPAICVCVFVSVFKNAVWARMYKELKPKNGEKITVSGYENPEEEEDISYIKKEE